MARGFSERKQAGFDSAAKLVEPDEQPAASGNPNRAMVRLGPGGRVVIPSEMREAMGLKQGDGMIATLNQEGELKLVSLLDKVRELHEITKKYHPEGVSMVDEFLAEKYAETARENEKD